MVLLINNSYDSNSDHHFLNCYFLKKKFVWLNFFSQFLLLIFNFIKIKLYNFSRLGASSLITQVTNLIKLTYFLKDILFIFNQIISII
jgi:hypothetical protein